MVWLLTLCQYIMIVPLSPNLSGHTEPGMVVKKCYKCSPILTMVRLQLAKMMSYVELPKNGSIEPLHFQKTKDPHSFSMHDAPWCPHALSLRHDPFLFAGIARLRAGFSTHATVVPWAQNEESLISSAYTDQRTNARYIGIAFWVYCFNIPMEIWYFSAPDFMLICKLKVPVSPALNITSLQPQDFVDTWFIFRHGEWNTSAV